MVGRTNGHGARTEVRRGESKGTCRVSPWQRRARPGPGSRPRCLCSDGALMSALRSAPSDPGFPDVVRSRIAGQGHSLRVPRELRHCRDQGRRGDLHELRQHARRSHPLGGRLPEPGAALHRAAAAAARPPTTQHPLGYGKSSYFWSFIVALLLFSMGGLFSIYEGWHKLRDPEDLNKVWVALVVLGVAIALETASLMGCLREIRKVRAGRPFLEWLRAHAQRRAGRRARRGHRGARRARDRVRVRVARLGDGRHALGRSGLDCDRRRADRRRDLHRGADHGAAARQVRRARRCERQLDELIAADPRDRASSSTPSRCSSARRSCSPPRSACSPISRSTRRSSASTPSSARSRRSIPNIGWSFVEPDVTD